MRSLSFQRLAVLGFLLFATGVCLSVEGPPSLSVQSLYASALRNYSAGMYSEALSLFLQVQVAAGPYGETHGYIARCAEALAAQREKDALSETVNQARGMLALRESALNHLTRKGGVQVDRDDESHVLRCPAGLFEDGSVRDALTAFIATVPGAWVTVMSEFPSTGDRGISREALFLAERLVREGGFSSRRLTLRSLPGASPGLTISVSPRQPTAGSEGMSLPGVLVRADPSQLKLGSVEEMMFSLFILDSEKGRRWNLKLMDEQGGVSRSFEGPSTVLTQVRWDGHDDEGRRAAPGRYVARLTVSGWGEDLLATDTVSFSVVQPAVLTRPAPSPTEPSLPAQRQHRVVIRFQDNAAVPIQRERDVAARVAYLLTINPGKKVSVAGSAGASEKNPRPLAGQRAGWVREELLRLGVPEGRIRVGELSGEGGPEAVVVFEESDENIP
ncbi:MAG: hypothetical protein IPN90_08825 [Elusimicrobia bacterium]|nr:hypothetical protein [Elusimicrobiota bacterium]